MNRNKERSNYRNIVTLIVISMFFIPTAQQLIFANHGKEIDLKFNDAQFYLLPTKNIQQVKFTTTYSVSDTGTVSKHISGTMKIYAENGTLIKTTSIPNGFKADKTGFQQFVTSLPATSPKTITAIVLFTDLNKTSPMSNSINRDLALNKTQ